MPYLFALFLQLSLFQISVELMFLYTTKQIHVYVYNCFMALRMELSGLQF